MGDSQGQERDLQEILLTMNNAAPLNVNAELRLALPRRPFYGPVKGKRKFGLSQPHRSREPLVPQCHHGELRGRGMGQPPTFPVDPVEVDGVIPGLWHSLWLLEGVRMGQGVQGARIAP